MRLRQRQICYCDKAIASFAFTLHLDQKLSLDPAGRFALVLVSGAAHGVDLIDEDDWRLVLPSQTEQILH